MSSVLGFPGGSGKESACSAGDLASIPGSGRCPGGGNGTYSSVLGESHGPRSLLGDSPQGHKELGMTECAHTHTHTHTHTSLLLPSDVFYFIFEKVLQGTH